MRILVRLFLNGIAVYVASLIVPGLHLSSLTSAFVAGLLLGIVNVLVRPLLFLVTLPLTILTLGLFLFVINGVCLAIVAWLMRGFSIDGLSAAILGALLVTIVNWLLNRALFPRTVRR
jgi:putative membrane protein